MKKVFALALALIFPNSSVTAEGIEQVFPVEAEKLGDHRISKCESLRGFGMIHYSNSSHHITALSDFCIDENLGVVVSAEMREGFQLVEKSRRGRSMEILETGTDAHTRVRMSFMQDIDSASPNCTAENLFSFEYNIPDGKLSHNKGLGYARAQGYTIPATTNRPLIPRTQLVLLSIRNFSQHDLPSKTASLTQLPEGADMYGELSFDEASGTFGITEGGGYWVGDANGDLKLQIDESGEVLISGRFDAKSQRIAGHEPHEWVRMTANIPFMRGHILGEDGRQLKSYGFVRGNYVDASGKQHEFRASAQLVACFSE